MTRLGDVVDVTQQVLDEAAAWYARQEVVPPAAFAGLDRAVLDVALALAGGVYGRLEVLADGGVLVHNWPVW